MAKQQKSAKRSGAKPAKAGAARPGKKRAPTAKRPAAKPAPKAKSGARKTAPPRAPAPRAAPPAPAAAKAPVAPTPPPAPRAAPVVAPRPPVAPVVRPATPPEPVRMATRTAPPPPIEPRRSDKSPSEMPVYAGLNEADLLRMSADDYMNAQQLAYFREMLVAMKRQLLENADVTSEHLRENDIVPDPADRATIEEEHTLELRTRDRERKLMRKIDESIARIADGSYGWCEETGEPIGLQRLLARPTATLSVEAQARRELKQKLYGE